MGIIIMDRLRKKYKSFETEIISYCHGTDIKNPDKGIAFKLTLFIF